MLQSTRTERKAGHQRSMTTAPFADSAEQETREERDGSDSSGGPEAFM
jgi:hypothetical protein